MVVHLSELCASGDPLAGLPVRIIFLCMTKQKYWRDAKRRLASFGAQLDVASTNERDQQIPGELCKSRPKTGTTTG